MPPTLLPQEPAPPSPQQLALTQQFLQPGQAGIHAFWQHLRAQADTVLRPRQPSKCGKPYPLGQCLEICQHVLGLLKHHMQTHAPPPPDPLAQQGLACLRAFFAAGGELRMIWGDLRGLYFQNAMQLGAWYVDVANDTVFPDKPPVEVLPFAECGMTAIRDFFHFAHIAGKYWGGALYPNHLFPALAPWFPLISVVAGAGVQLEPGNDYMIALARRDGFHSAQQVLASDAPPPALAAAMAPLFAEPSWGFDGDGCLPALACCHRLHQTPPDEAERDAAVRRFWQINQRLAGIQVDKQ